MYVALTMCPILGEGEKLLSPSLEKQLCHESCT